MESKSHYVDKLFLFDLQVLSSFEDVSLQSILDRVKEKHNLKTVKKVRQDVFYLDAPCWDSADVSPLSPLFQKLIRNVLFGNMFGVLALQQSGRLSKVSCPLCFAAALWVTMTCCPHRFYIILY